MRKILREISLILILSLVLSLFACPFALAGETGQDKLLIYVDQSKGSDSAEGTLNRPLKTLRAAQNLVRTLPKNKPIEVLVGSGTYEKLTFTNQDSGTKEGHITYKAMEGAEVRISGSKKVDLSGFTKVTDPQIVARMREEAYPYIGQIKLLDYGFTAQELDMINEQGNAYYINPVRRPVPLIVMFNGQEQTLAEYPNNGEWMRVLNVTDPGAVGSGQSYANWVDNGHRSTFKYTDPRIASWTRAKDIFIEGYIGVDWGQDQNFVKEINVKEGTLQFSEAVNFALKDGDRIRFSNFVEELDLPGEWVIDQESYIMYYYPPYKVDPKKDDLEIVTSTVPLIDVQKTAYVTIDGFILENNKTYAVNIANGDNFNIKNCIIRNINTDGIFMYGKECVIEGNQIMYVGSRGVNLSGGAEWKGEPNYRLDLSNPNSIQIKNNYFYQCGYCGIEVTGKNNVGLKLENNVIQKTPDSMGLRYAGVDGSISYNEIANCTRTVGDLGPLYAGREMTDFGNIVSYNYIHHYGAEYESDEAVSGIYWDDYQCGQIGLNNIMAPFNHQITYATHLASGAHNVLKYNIVIESKTGIMAKDRNEYGMKGVDFTKQESYTNGKKNITDSIIAKYPDVLEAFEYIENHPEHRHSPLKNTITDNFTVSCQTNSNSISQSIIDLGTVENNTIAETGVDLKDIFVDPDNHDFRIKASAMEEYNLAPEFINENNFDMELMGIDNSVLDMSDKKGEFRLIYPSNGAVNIPSNDVTIKWENAVYSDYYYYDVATDPEFKNIIKSGKTQYASVNLGKLENSKSYYWRVSAENITKEMGKMWDCTGGPYLFTITDKDKTDKSILKKTIDELGYIFDTDYTESNKPGEYKIGTNDALKGIIKDARQIYSSSSSIQTQIDGMVEKLSNVSKALDGYKNAGWTTFDLSGKDAFIGVNPSMVANYTGDSVIISGTTDTVHYKDLFSGSDVLKFKAKMSFDATNGWYGFTLKKNNTATAVWDANTYLIIIKPALIEFQKYNAAASKTGILIEKENTFFEPNKWYDIEFGAVEVVGGEYVFMKANGQEVISYFDTENPILGPGYFCLKPLKDGTIEIKPVTEGAGELYLPPENIFEMGQEEELKGETFDYNSSELTTKEGSFEEVEGEGFDGNKVYAGEGNAEYVLVQKDSIKTIWYWHSPIEDGDEDAKISISYSDAAAKFEIVRDVNFKKGEAGWVNLGTYHFKSYGGDKGQVELKITGSGEGKVVIPTVMLTEPETEHIDFTNIFNTKAKNMRALKIGSNIAFDRINKVKLPDAVPEIVGDRTFVPLRFVSEILGADVSYDDKTNTAEIKLKDTTVYVKPGNDYIKVNGEKVTLDSKVFEKEGRMFIPLRAVSEAMNKKVLWLEDTSVILIADDIMFDEKDTSTTSKIAARFE